MRLAFSSTERLSLRGMVTALQLEGEQYAVDKAGKDLEAANEAQGFGRIHPKTGLSNSRVISLPPKLNGRPTKNESWTLS